MPSLWSGSWACLLQEDGTIWVFPSVLVHLSSCNKGAQTGKLINKQKLFFFNSGAWKFKIKVPEMSPLSSHGLLLVFSQGRRHKGLSPLLWGQWPLSGGFHPHDQINSQLPITFTSQQHYVGSKVPVYECINLRWRGRVRSHHPPSWILCRGVSYQSRRKLVGSLDSGRHQGVTDLSLSPSSSRAQFVGGNESCRPWKW